MTLRLYTKTGDKGETQLIGKRVRKTNDRVEAYGTIDELNSFIGLAIHSLTQAKEVDLLEDLQNIQHELFDLGGDLANVTKKKEWALKEDSLTYLEERIDQLSEEAPQLRAFILPGGELSAAHLHICRTVTRRAEREVLKITDEDELPPLGIKYLNRLSDYFFSAARVVNARNNRGDLTYKKK